MKSSTLLLSAGCTMSFCLGVSAHIRILHPSNGNPVRWSDGSNVGIAISPLNPSGVGDGSHVTALRNTVEAWNSVPGSFAHLVETPAAETSDWNADNIHLITFEQDNASGYFPAGSGTVAVTPIFFFGSGAIADADILFNDGGYSFSTDGAAGTFDIADVATHELGHFLGLDHSGSAGATMFPYVSPTGILHRSLSVDDLNGIRHNYPGASFASLTGTVERADGSPVFGAHLVARDEDGRLVGATITDVAGAYRFEGLEGGTYAVYATPLDAPVSGANLTGSPDLDTDFQFTNLPGQVLAAPGAVVDLGTLVVAADAVLQLGRSSDSLPLRGIRGQEVTLSLRGAGLDLGSTLTASDSDLTVTPVNWLGSFVSFRVDVPLAEDLGHVDLIVTNAAGDRAVLAGAIELTPPDPIVNTVSPASGSNTGGTPLAILGSNFSAGLRVVVGDRIYEEGQPGGATLVSSSELQLTTSATVGGLHDVVVIDASGVEGRLGNGFLSAQIPVVSSVFPGTGSADGGTVVTVTGVEFASGAEVRIDGVVQANVVVESSEKLAFTTAAAGPESGLELSVVNPGGSAGASNFSYVAGADPDLVDVDPPSGESGGGELIELSGSNFPDEHLEVRFGVDPETGAGGVLAASVERLDSSTLRVETPGGSGTQSVLVRNTDTGQADVLEAAYTYEGASGGGGCTMALPGPGSGGSSAGALLVWSLAGLIAAVAGLLAGTRATEPRRPLPLA